MIKYQGSSEDLEITRLHFTFWDSVNKIFSKYFGALFLDFISLKGIKDSPLSKEILTLV